MKKAGIVVGIIMAFSVMMSSFIFFYHQAISKGIPVIVSEQQFENDYFEELGKIVVE